MKVLFIYRGYGETLSNSVIDFQRASLLNKGIEIDSFAFGKGGIKGYFAALGRLKNTVKEKQYDILHAHYSFSGFFAGLIFGKPVICSLMGSDVLQVNIILKKITWFYYKYIWNRTIVKSKESRKLFPNALLIPNGIDLLNFRPIVKQEALKKTAFNESNYNIIFVAENIDSKVKNIALAKKAIDLLRKDFDKVILHSISDKTFTELPYFYSAADVLLLTSLSEGSPNVVKEAMACNCPIVATDVGDVREVIGKTEGCSVTNFDPVDVAQGLKKAIVFGKRTNGRDHVQSFDNQLVAERIIEVYKSVLKR